MYSFSAVLSYGPIIVCHGNMVVTWNESLTLNSWLIDGNGFAAVDTCTLGDVPTLAEAREHAERWLAGTDDE